MKMKLILISTLLALSGCTSHYAVLSDIKINSLQIKWERHTHSYCKSGYSESLTLTGPISSDSTEVLERIIGNMHRCISSETGARVSREIILSSDGGTLKDGYKMASLFRKHSMTTTVPRGKVCASACAVAFMGGIYRRMRDDSTLLFHSPYYSNGFAIPISGIGIDCAKPSEVQDLKTHMQKYIGTTNGDFLFKRAMSYCSTTDGWTLNRDAAKMFGLVND